MFSSLILSFSDTSTLFFNQKKPSALRTDIQTANESFNNNKGTRLINRDGATKPKVDIPLVDVDDEHSRIPDPTRLSRHEIAEMNSPYSLLNPDPTTLAYESRFALTESEKVMTKTTRKNMYSAKHQIRYILLGSFAAYYLINVGITYFMELKIDLLSKKKDRLLFERNNVLDNLSKVAST